MYAYQIYGCLHAAHLCTSRAATTQYTARPARRALLYNETYIAWRDPRCAANAESRHIRTADRCMPRTILLPPRVERPLGSPTSHISSSAHARTRFRSYSGLEPTQNCTRTHTLTRTHTRTRTHTKDRYAAVLSSTPRRRHRRRPPPRHRPWSFSSTVLATASTTRSSA